MRTEHSVQIGRTTERDGLGDGAQLAQYLSIQPNLRL